MAGFPDDEAMGSKTILRSCLACFMLCPALFASAARLPETRPFPVLAWSGIPEAQTTEARYRELADCGFTIDFSSFSTVAKTTKALDMAAKAGVQILISCPELASDPQGSAKRLMTHSALAGYFIGDEPKVADFQAQATWIQKIRSVDKTHVVYVNLLPDYGTPEQFGAPNYQQYVDRFASTVPTDFLSFDYYPIVGDSVRPSWYSNLGVIADAAQKANRPFWAFALSLRHFGYPAATMQNLREEIYSDLAYGAQGIQYFTYWQPGFDSADSPIDAKGNRTAVYDRVKQMNAEIRAVSPAFLGSRVLSLGHTGATLPPGTTPYHAAAPIKSLKTEGQGAIVSVLANGNHRYLVIVNRDIDHPMPTTVEFDASARPLRVAKDGTLNDVNAPSQPIVVDPGDALLFTWEPR